MVEYEIIKRDKLPGSAGGGESKFKEIREAVEGLADDEMLHIPFEDEGKCKRYVQGLRQYAYRVRTFKVRVRGLNVYVVKDGD
jgi:hypothetical protein